MKTNLTLGLLTLALAGLAQNSFPPTSGIVHVNGATSITNPTNRLEVYEGTGAYNHVGIGGVGPVIKWYGGNTVPTSPPSSIPYGRIGLATGNNNFIAGSVPGDFCIQNMSTSNSLIFSSYYNNSNGTEHMRINETGNVGIGITTPGFAKVSVLNIDPIIPNGVGGIRWGLKAHIIPQEAKISDGIDETDIGVEGKATTAFTGEQFMTGVAGYASNGRENRGGYFEATGGDCAIGLNNFGVHVGATGNAYNYGIYSSAWGGCIADYAGWFNGDVHATGNVTWFSDRRIKENVKALTNTMDKIKQLKPSTYTFKSKEFPELYLPTNAQVGLISQELEQWFPELVRDVYVPATKGKKAETYKAIQYVSLIPVLIAGMQEQQIQLDDNQKENKQLSEKLGDLQKQVDEQKIMIAALNQGKSTTTAINANSSQGKFQMEQNEPNPFSTETLVWFTLPQTVANAEVLIYDLTGKQITSYPIPDRGTASVKITSEHLAPGLYIYAIVADGKVVDTKRMMLTDK